MTSSHLVLTYSGPWLERASAQRGDPRWVESVLARAGSRVVPMWCDRCLVAGEGPAPVELPAAEAGELLAVAGDRVLLGLDGEAGVFAADLSPLAEAEAVRLAGASAVADVRRLVSGLSARAAATLAYARGVLHWNRHRRFCGVCGGATESRHGGHLRACTRESCGRLFFPRIEPAVIVLVEAPGTPGRCLLGRHRKAPEGSWSTLAGFVEIGESLEDAVRREVAEEAGVELAAVTYRASQAWPFPAGLMVGFRARAASERIAVDREELAEARWFSRQEISRMAVAGNGPGLFNDDSIERFLIESWLDEPEEG